MANFTETDEFEPNIYKLATVDALAGGDAGKLNTATQQLANRTKNLDRRLKGLVFNVKDYGAVGDGVADDTDAINDTIVACNAAGGGQVWFPPGTYKANGEIVLADKAYLVGSGQAASLIDMSASTAVNYCIYGNGTAIALANQFTTSIAEQDRSIRFSASPGVTAGDILIIYNSTDGSYNSARTCYRAGEFVRTCKAYANTTINQPTITSPHASGFWVGAVVTGAGIPGGTTVLSISNNTITLSANATATATAVEVTLPNTVFLERGTYEGYAAAGTTSIYKLTPIRSGMADLAAVFPAGDTGIYVTYGADLEFSGLKLRGSGISNLTVTKCWNSSVSRCNIESDVGPVTGTNYGITVSNSQRTRISNCEISVHRHAIATGGGDSVCCVPVREINVINNHLTCKGNVYAFDLHGNTEHAIVTGNHMLGGAALAGDYVTFSNNTLTSMKDIGTCMTIGEMVGPNFKIEGNTFLATGNFTTSLMVIANTGFASMRRNGLMRIAGNLFDWRAYVHTLSMNTITITNTSVDYDVTLEVVGNTIIGTSDSGAIPRQHISILGSGILGFRRVIVKNNTLRKGGIRVEKIASTMIEISGNSITEAGVYGIFVFPYTTAYGTNQPDQTILVKNNNVDKSAYGGIVLYGDFDGSLTTMVVENNFSINHNQYATTGSSSTDSSLTIIKALNAFVRNNIFGKMLSDTGTQLTTMYLSNITNLYESGNANVGTLATTLASVTNQYGDFTTLGKQKSVGGTAAPVLGTWVVGDTVVNTAPTPGGPTGWVCTTAGTDLGATWKVDGYAKGLTQAITAATGTVLATSSNVTVSRVGAVAVTLPASTYTGPGFRVKDISGTCSPTNVITFVAGAGTTVETAYELNEPYDSITWYLDGTVWRAG